MEKNKKVHLNKNEIHDVNGGGDGDGQCPHCHGELPPRHHGGFGPPPPPPNGHNGPPHHGHYGPPPPPTPGGFGPPPHHQPYEPPQREKISLKKSVTCFPTFFASGGDDFDLKALYDRLLVRAHVYGLRLGNVI